MATAPTCLGDVKIKKKNKHKNDQNATVEKCEKRIF